MIDERWRCFVALAVGDALRADLAVAVRAWQRRDDLAQLRWSEADDWHLTLAFLGATDPARVPRLLKLLRDRAAEHGPMRLATGGLGGFPSAARARVAWYGVADAHGTLAALAHDVRATLDLDATAPFRAHVTLARSRRAPVDLRRWLASAATSAPSGSLEVDRIVLVRSHLGHGPARHEPLGSVPLGVPAHV